MSVVPHSYNTYDSFLEYTMCSGSFGNLSQDTVQYALNVAADEVNMSLQPRYALDNDGFLQNPPFLVLECELVLAAYRLFLIQGFNPGVGSNRNAIVQRYKEIRGDADNPASGILGMLAYGKMALPMPQQTGFTGTPTGAAPLNTPIVASSAFNRSWFSNAPSPFGRNRNLVW